MAEYEKPEQELSSDELREQEELRLEREYFYRETSVFDTVSSDELEEAREEVESIIEAASEPKYTIIDLSKVIKREDLLNPKSFKNIHQTYVVGSKFARSVPSSSTNAKRYISVQAYNWNALADPTSGMVGWHSPEDGLVVRVTKKPNNGTGYDEVVSVSDITNYTNGFANNPTSSAYQTVQNDSQHITLLYKFNAFTPAAGYYNIPSNSGMLAMTIQVDFQSGHTEKFYIKAPIGQSYSTGPHSLEYQFGGSVGGTMTIQSVNECSEYDFYSQGPNIVGSARALQGTYGVLTQWSPVDDPGGNMQEVSMYSSHSSPLYYSSTTAESNFVIGNFASHGDYTYQVLGATQGLTHIDKNETGRQEIHRIDTVLQNNSGGYTTLIANQPESWYQSNFTVFPTYSNYFYYIGNSISSFNNTVSIVNTQNQNQLFTYTVYYAENITSCGTTPILYEYYVCTDAHNPSNFITTGLDCNGNIIPTTHLPGGSVYQTGVVSFNSANCCTKCDVTLSVQAYDATYGNNDGYLEWSALTNIMNPNTASGNPFNTNSFYTLTITAANGASLTGTLPPTGGNTVTVATTVNDTSGTANRFTVSSNAQITPGMQIVSGHTFYSAATGGTATAAYVGAVYAGNLSQNATEFYIVDAAGNSLYSQSDATPSLLFGTGTDGAFGALAPNTSANPYYEVCITDEDGCKECTQIYIREETKPVGCTDSTAVNYNATAVIDDGSCILCRTSDGLLHDPSGSGTTSLFDSYAFASGHATWNSGYGASTTHNTDGALQVTASPVSAVVPYIDYDANTKFEILVYKVVNQGDPSTAVGASLVQTINAGTLNNVSVAAANITGLAYGYYTLRFRLVDANDVSTMEDCWSEFNAVVKAEVCDDSNVTEYMTVPSDPDLRAPTPSLCAAGPCCDVSPPYQLDQCSGNVAVDITCEPSRIVHPITLSYSANNTTYAVVAQLFTSGTGPTVSNGLSFYFPGIMLTHGTGYYEVSIDAYTTTGSLCTTSKKDFLKLAAFGCTDSSAVNYDPMAVCDAGCIYESFDCDGQGNCFDPGTGNGQYSTITACQQDCPVPPVYGCTDSCAVNHNPMAMVDDGSCLYKACKDPTATNYNYSCDCNAQKPNATINDQACCISPCQLPETITSTVTNATNTCTSYSADGTVSIEFSNSNGAASWTFEIYDAVGTTLIYADPTTYTNPTTTSATYSTLISGIYTAQVTTSFGCIFTEQFTIGSTGPTLGCTDPDADNYDPTAVCDDGTCFICGCSDPNANNYNPNATSICPCEYDIDGATPCVPENVNDFIERTRGCLTLKGSDWLFDYKLGRASDCPMMDKWKLILIEYLLTQDKEGIDCLYTCADLNVLDASAISCTDLWIQGGPSTGINHDINHKGAYLQSGGGTVVTSYDGYPTGWFGYQNPGVGPNVVHPQYTGPARSNLTYVGDMVKWDLPTYHPLASQLNGTIWELTTTPPATNTWNTMGGHQGCKLQKITHYTQCGQYRKVDVTETTNYYEKFLNFVNKFCKDCNISILKNK